MLGALRLMTVERGIDPRGFSLMPFGGAGPLHAASMASELGISRVLSPRAGGVLCALGLAAAAPRRDLSRTILRDLGSITPGALEDERARLLLRAGADLGAKPARVRITHELRYHGQSFELSVREELGPAGEREGMRPGELREAFERAHAQRYGYRDAERGRRAREPADLGVGLRAGPAAAGRRPPVGSLAPAADHLRRPCDRVGDPDRRAVPRRRGPGPSAVGACPVDAPDPAGMVRERRRARNRPPGRAP